MYYYLCFFFFQEPVQEWHIFCGSGSCFFLSGSGSLFFSPPTPAPKDPKTPGSSALVKKMVSTTNTNIQSFHFSRQYYFFLLSTNLNFLILGRFPQIIDPNIYSCKNHKFWPYQIYRKKSTSYVQELLNILPGVPAINQRPVWGGSVSSQPVEVTNMIPIVDILV